MNVLSSYMLCSESNSRSDIGSRLQILRLLEIEHTNFQIKRDFILRSNKQNLMDPATAEYFPQLKLRYSMTLDM